MESYYQECKKNNDWPRLIDILEPVWEREYFRIEQSQNESQDKKLSNPRLGDSTVIPLMEAYIHQNRHMDADTIFNAWLNCGGAFTNTAKILELAREKGQERLAREWETRLKKPLRP
jgi:hypothetical protein